MLNQHWGPWKRSGNAGSENGTDLRRIGRDGPAEQRRNRQWRIREEEREIRVIRESEDPGGGPGEGRRRAEEAKTDSKPGKKATFQASSLAAGICCTFPIRLVMVCEAEAALAPPTPERVTRFSSNPHHE